MAVCGDPMGDCGDLQRQSFAGSFYRSVKQAVSLRLDSDVIAWLKKDGQGYQTRANQMQRERMLEDLKER
jgi:uncharacterized protein (DUF4415 family)